MILKYRYYLKNRSGGKSEKFPAQISFPGGKSEGDETLYQTVIRETLEETNLDLNDWTKFVHCGEFPATLPLIQIKNVGKIWVKWYMFMQIWFDELETISNPREIDELIWTSLEYFVENSDKNINMFDCYIYPNTPKQIIARIFSIKLLDSTQITVTDNYKNSSAIKEDWTLAGVTYYFILYLIRWSNLTRSKDHFNSFNKYFYYTQSELKTPIMNKILWIPRLSWYNPNTYYMEKWTPEWVHSFAIYHQISRAHIIALSTSIVAGIFFVILI